MWVFRVVFSWFMVEKIFKSVLGSYYAKVYMVFEIKRLFQGLDKIG